MENEFDWQKMEKEQEERDARMKAHEEQGLADIYKYFDRINDKLSAFNNLLVAGYFGLVTFDADVWKAIIIIPLINMILLLRIDYIMMEQGRRLSQITSLPVSEIEKYGKVQMSATQLSLLTIISTLVVTAVFIGILYGIVIK